MRTLTPALSMILFVLGGADCGGPPASEEEARAPRAIPVPDDVGAGETSPDDPAAPDAPSAPTTDPAVAGLGRTVRGSGAILTAAAEGEDALPPPTTVTASADPRAVWKQTTIALPFASDALSVGELPAGFCGPYGPPVFLDVSAVRAFGELAHDGPLPGIAWGDLSPDTLAPLIAAGHVTAHVGVGLVETTDANGCALLLESLWVDLVDVGASFWHESTLALDPGCPAVVAQ